MTSESGPTSEAIKDISLSLLWVWHMTFSSSGFGSGCTRVAPILHVSFSMHLQRSVPGTFSSDLLLRVFPCTQHNISREFLGELVHQLRTTMEHTGIRHEQWDFVPFDAGVETADGPLPKDEEKAVSEKLLPTIEYACITEEQQVRFFQPSLYSLCLGIDRPAEG